MELHALWNRIDQLEQLILTQAKEIDALRRIVNESHHINKPNCGIVCPAITMTNNDEVSKIYSNNNTKPTTNISNHSTTSPHTASPYTLAQINRLGSTLTSCRGSPTVTKTSTVQSNRPMCRPNYVMNPFVHPASAIPPVADRTLAARNDHLAMRTSASPSGMYNNYHNPGVHFRAPLTSRTLPANTRWSTGPSLLGTLTDLDPNDVDKPRKRRNKMSLIELVTCFCPCFSMC